MVKPDEPSGSLGVERELKLEAEPVRLKALLGDPLIKDLLVKAPRRRRMVTTYFDTPDRLLRELGCSLRVRRDGRRYIMTIKRENRTGNLLFARDEWEAPVSGEQPDLALLADPALQDLATTLQGQVLEPVIRSEVTRTSGELAWTGENGGKATIALSLDEGLIAAGGRQLPIGEMELEVVDGDPDSLFALALRITEKLPLRFGTLGKWERGFQLLTEASPGSVKAGRPVLAEGIGMEDAMEQSLRAALRQWTANEPAILASADPEGVHQMRVALRRFRSLLLLFRHLIPDVQRIRLKNELRGVLDVLGPARDLDVFALDLLEPVVDHLGGRDRFAALTEALGKARAAATGDVRFMLGSSDYARAVLRATAWVETRGWRSGVGAADADMLAADAREVGRELLAKRLKKVLKLGKNYEELEPHDRHLVRIALKKLRYGADAFGSLYPPDLVQPYLKTLSNLQDHMGKANDAAMAGSIAERITPGAGHEVGHLAGLVIGWHAHAAIADEPELLSAWRKFKKTEPFWEQEA